MHILKTDKSLNEIYVSLASEMNKLGLRVSIVGGQACIQYGLAEFTKDLDIIAPVENYGRLLTFLSEQKIYGGKCRYRFGHGAPLSSPWLDGGWTSHFYFPSREKMFEPCIDVFGLPPRVLGKYYGDGLFAEMGVIASMKMTKRMRDWAFVTSLGIKMINSGVRAGLLNIFDDTKLIEAVGILRPDKKMIETRPVLMLALEKNPLLGRAVRTEVDFWTIFDTKRLNIYKDAWKNYFIETKKHRTKAFRNLLDEHCFLEKCAKKHLPAFPLNDYGVKRLFAECRDDVMLGLSEQLYPFLPNTTELEKHLAGLAPYTL